MSLYSEKFFERYIKNVNWTYFCGNTSLSEGFFEKYIAEGADVNWNFLLINNFGWNTKTDVKPAKR